MILRRIFLRCKVVPQNRNDLKKHHRHRDPRIQHHPGRKQRHHCLPQDLGASFIHPKQLSPIPEHLELPFPNGWIHSGFEDIVSSDTDLLTTWTKTDPDMFSVRHMVDVQKAVAEFREASERTYDTSSEAYHFDKYVPNRSPVQKRLSIYNWNPGPRRGKEDAFEQQIAGKWHIITLQEASEYVDRDILTNRFHVTHYRGCAILYNKETFHPAMDVKSIHLHDTMRELPDQAVEGVQGWVMQGVLARASFRRPPLSGQKTFTVLCLHKGNVFAKKRGIAQNSSSQSVCHYDWSTG